MGKLKLKKTRGLPDLHLSPYEIDVMKRFLKNGMNTLTAEEMKVVELLCQRSVDVAIKQKQMLGKLPKD